MYRDIHMRHTERHTHVHTHTHARHTCTETYTCDTHRDIHIQTYVCSARMPARGNRSYRHRQKRPTDTSKQALTFEEEDTCHPLDTGKRDLQTLANKHSTETHTHTHTNTHTHTATYKHTDGLHIHTHTRTRSTM
jgi:hypothetical protein